MASPTGGSRKVHNHFIPVDAEGKTGVQVERRSLAVKDFGAHECLKPFVGLPVTHIGSVKATREMADKPPPLIEITLPQHDGRPPVMHAHGGDHVELEFEAVPEAVYGKIRYSVGGVHRQPFTKVMWDTDTATGGEPGRLIMDEIESRPGVAREGLPEFLSALLALCRRMGITTNITETVKIRDTEATFDVVEAREGAIEEKDGVKGIALRFIDPIPVTVLSGFLGSGKTTLMNKLLSNREGLRCAVIVNDMSEIQIDAALISGLRRQEEKMVEFHNGCICCTLRDDLIGGVADLAEDPMQFDYLIIESTGISEPLPVAHTFELGVTKTGLPLRALAKLDTLVTVVDTKSFSMNLRDKQTLAQMRMSHDKDERDLGSLFADQVEGANVVLLNKCDLAEMDHRLNAKSLVLALNETAHVYETVECNIELKKALGTGLYVPGSNCKNEMWIAETERVPHKPESQEFGITSFGWSRIGPQARAFHRDRFETLLDQMRPIGEVLTADGTPHAPRPDGPFNDCLYRAKGFVWMAHFAALQLNMHVTLAGPMMTPTQKEWAAMDLFDGDDKLQANLLDAWDRFDDARTEKLLAERIANPPEKETPVAAAARKTILRLQAEGKWHPVAGDRRLELIFIGDIKKMNRPAMEKALEECLATEEEIKEWRVQIEDALGPSEYVTQS